jgi:ribonuclease T2
MKSPKASNNKAAVWVAVTTCMLGAISAIVYERESSAPSAPPPEGPAARTAAPRSDGAASRADFDFYLMAMSVHAAWCADGNTGKRECRAGGDRPLVIHGLWPERLEPRTYPRDCAGPRLDLEPGTESELRAFMPGMQSGLHVHEWREHGTCSGLGDDGYFRATVSLARGLDAALRPVLTTHAGGEIHSADLRAAANQRQPGLGRTFTLHCRTLRDAPPGRRDRAFLVEVRQCVDDDGAGGAPGTPVDCATVDRRDQGCGGSFGILAR